MGTFLCEEISKENPFENTKKEELQNRVIETLLEFGECALEQIVLYGSKIYVYDYKNLERKNDYYILSYNRFENDSWEPTYMNTSLAKFNGVRERGIGSKIGFRQHYTAMAVSRVLCECYSSGNYYIYGDIGMQEIIKCLVYIGKKYGFELVENFIEYRTNFKIIKNKENYSELFWGVKGRDFYIKRFTDMKFDDWKEYMEKRFTNELIKVERGETCKYEGTSVYLASLLLNSLCEKELIDKLRLDRVQLLEELKRFIQNYYISVIEKTEPESLEQSWDYSQYSGLEKYSKFFEEVDIFLYLGVVCNKDMFYKSVSNLIEKSQREDIKELMDEFQKMMDEMVISKEVVDETENIMIGWKIYYCLQKETDQKERKQELLDYVKEIAEKSNIKDTLVDDDCLKELFLGTVSTNPMSDKLTRFLKTIFSKKRQMKYKDSLDKANQSGKDNEQDGVRKLFSIAEKLYEKSRMFFPSDLFYRLLKEAFVNKGIETLNMIDFYLNDLSKIEQKKAFLWVLQDEKLCNQYLPRTGVEV